MPFHKGLFPTFKGSAILTQIERITQPVTDFIRGNPIVSTAAIGIGTTGLVTGIARTVRTGRKKRKKAKARKVTRRRVKKRIKGKRRKKARRVTHRSPRHKGHKKVMFTTKDGKRVSFLVRRKTSPVHRRRRRSR